MGKGIDLARGVSLLSGGSGLHAQVLDDFKDQLIIVMLKRLKALGHPLTFSVEEIDDTGQDIVSFSVVNRTFRFELSKKS